MFFRRWMANPLPTGSVAPSSTTLCRRIVEQISRGPDEAVLELGAGTGVISRAMLVGGIPVDRLIVVEIVPDMVAHLRDVLAGVTVVERDARRVRDLIPARFAGRIGTVVCGIPLVLLPQDEQRRFIAAFDAVAPGRGLLHFSHCATSPLPARYQGLRARREAWTALNVPPASVWRYVPERAAI
jgi:phosphatidylethanolamine/phosphatidyl-N-methylethanolamine N-methyltransferase